jgi:hypothetical protein
MLGQRLVLRDRIDTAIAAVGAIEPALSAIAASGLLEPHQGRARRSRSATTPPNGTDTPSQLRGRPKLTENENRMRRAEWARARQARAKADAAGAREALPARVERPFRESRAEDPKVSAAVALSEL